jgi:glycosyltransferase involved in cell wall biosynthesis
MRAAFYAPMKPPDHAVPSGDRSIARLFLAALQRAGFATEVASSLRTWCKDPEGIARLQPQAAIEAARLTARWQADPPDLWFTYHVYYKAPDWIGPAVCRTLGIPYVIAEASYAPKRAAGPWAAGHAAAGAAIRDADMILSPTRLDMNCIAGLLHNKNRNVFFPPFLDHAPFARARDDRGRSRAACARDYDLDPDVPWLLTVAMMRDDAKRESYAVVARLLEHLRDTDYRYLIVGDGPAADDVKRMLSPWQDRIRFAGSVAPEALPTIYAAGDIYVWPAVDEAFGMAFLEAQAAGLPVIAGNERGVPDVTLDGTTALLAPPQDDKALAMMVRRLLADGPLRATMSRAAADFVARERSLDGAAQRLGGLLRPLLGGRTS